MIDAPPPMPVQHDPACIIVAAAAYRIPPETLLIIRMTEGGKPGTEHRNANSTIDYGPMQINTVNLPIFHRMKVTTDQIRDHECINVAASAYLLRMHLTATGDNQWKAMMRYHSNTPVYQQRYLAQLVKHYTRASTHFGPYLTWLRQKTLAYLSQGALPIAGDTPQSQPATGSQSPPADGHPAAQAPTTRVHVRVAGSGIASIHGP